MCVHSGLPNYRSRQAPAEEVRAAVPAAGHVQVPGDQSAARAHTGRGHADQEDPGGRRHGAARGAHHAAVLPQQRVRPRQPAGRGRRRARRPGGRVRAAHRRHVRRLLVVRATSGRRVPAERLQGVLQEPDGRREGRVQETVKCDGPVNPRLALRVYVWLLFFFVFRSSETCK